MAFQLIPFYDEPSWAMELDGSDPWSRLRHHYHPLTHLNQVARQLDRLRSDLHVDGGVVLKDNSYGVNLNVDGFLPKDLKVSLEDDMLTITGQHEDKSEDGTRFHSRQFTRSYKLPQHVLLDQMKSSLAADGRTLKIEAPIAKPGAVEAKQHQEIPIPIARSQAVDNKK